MKRYRMLLMTSLFLVPLVVCEQAGAQWPLDFAALARIRHPEKGLVLLEANTTFAQYLTEEFLSEGNSYLKLGGISSNQERLARSVPMRNPRVAMVEDGGGVRSLPSSSVDALNLFADAWTVVRWQLERGPWLRNLRLLSTEIALSGNPHVATGGLEFVGQKGKRLAWQEFAFPVTDQPEPRFTQLRVPFSDHPAQVRQVALWLRGDGVVATSPARVAAVAHDKGKILIRCNGEDSYEIGSASLVTDTGGWFVSEGIQGIRRIGPSEFEILAQPTSGWQNVSLVLETPDIRSSRLEVAPEASLTVLRTAGLNRIALEELSEAGGGRLSWRETVKPQRGDRLIAPLTPGVDRLGLWFLTEPGRRGRAAIRLRFLAHATVNDLPLHSPRTNCSLRRQPEALDLHIRSAQFGVRVEKQALAEAKPSASEARFAGLFLLGLLAFGALFVRHKRALANRKGD